jgi:hypothetical protein
MLYSTLWSTESVRTSVQHPPQTEGAERVSND